MEVAVSTTADSSASASDYLTNSSSGYTLKASGYLSGVVSEDSVTPYAEMAVTQINGHDISGSVSPQTFKNHFPKNNFGCSARCEFQFSGWNFEFL